MENGKYNATKIYSQKKRKEIESNIGVTGWVCGSGVGLWCPCVDGCLERSLKIERRPNWSDVCVELPASVVVSSRHRNVDVFLASSHALLNEAPSEERSAVGRRLSAG